MIRHLQRPFAIKSIGESDGTFTGYGSVFGELDSYRDIVMPGAFTKSLQSDFAAKGRKVPMLWQHNSRQPIGVYNSIKEDAHGLYVEGEINLDVQQGREAYSLMKQGALSGLSIGYETVSDKWVKEDMSRELLEVRLFEVSPVTFPAGDAARISTVKSLDSIDGLMSLSDCEELLRDAGNFSRKEALAFIARVKALGSKQSDSADEAVAASVRKAIETLRGITL